MFHIIKKCECETFTLFYYMRINTEQSKILQVDEIFFSKNSIITKSYAVNALIVKRLSIRLIFMIGENS